MSEKLAQALQTIATLTRSTAQKSKTNPQLQFDLQMDPVGYCGSHGYKDKLGHNSVSTIYYDFAR